jgi:hypothetical protein
VLTVAAAIGRRMAEGMTWLFRGSFRAVSSIALFAALLPLLSCRALSLPYRWLVTGSLLPDSLCFPFAGPWLIKVRTDMTFALLCLQEICGSCCSEM